MNVDLTIPSTSRTRAAFLSWHGRSKTLIALVQENTSDEILFCRGVTTQIPTTIGKLGYLPFAVRSWPKIG